MRPITFCAERSPSPGAVRPIPIDFDKSPHVVCTGGSGTGKSVASMLISAKVARIPTSQLYILDYKNDTDTFGFLHGHGPGCRYWRFEACMDGLNEYYERFQVELAADTGPGGPRPVRWLWIDELASWLLNIPKKDAESARSKIASLLMLGRSRRYLLLTTVQRASAELFAQGSRDNYNICIGMGALSKESAATLGFSREDFLPPAQVGDGHMIVNGNQIPIQVPYIGPKGMERMKEDILDGVTR